MQRIDIAKVIRAKNPKLARLLPRFVVGWIGALICVKKCNYIVDNFGECPAMDFIDATLEYIGTRYELHGTENIPKCRKLLFASNHPLGGVDGMVLATAIDKLKLNDGGSDVKLIVNDILFAIEPLRPIFIGINKHGAQRGNLSDQLGELYNSDSSIINFAAGFCSRKMKGGKIEDIPWKPNYVTRSLKSERVIIPTFVDALNSKFFYRLASLRKKLGIKANIEMLWLPRQMFYQKGKTIHIYFGEPVTVDNTKTAREWNNEIRTTVYELKKQYK